MVNCQWSMVNCQCEPQKRPRYYGGASPARLKQDFHQKTKYLKNIDRAYFITYIL
jgi:hypothetical protein